MSTKIYDGYPTYFEYVKNNPQEGDKLRERLASQQKTAQVCLMLFTALSLVFSLITSSSIVVPILSMAAAFGALTAITVKICLACKHQFTNGELDLLNSIKEKPIRKMAEERLKNQHKYQPDEHLKHFARSMDCEPTDGGDDWGKIIRIPLIKKEAALKFVQSGGSNNGRPLTAYFASQSDRVKKELRAAGLLGECSESF